ncbi:DoxX family protein [Natrinema pellirubrum DSM 15624]|uniref:DoxX family protein n=1 Tax=Natrinema pellirubrum (strain DSM 15624 / CIP 106293 / JCM 10476 / NCIMB 786 / 157) TaxID=797303 RepID=L0JLN4_NATP1|nr:DoxX family protein [Natrinema pellirubrum]AGB31487.1 putative membrane protein [Natrinema pellirubrum DSM 15624]ELY82211.1 DoxX family protein [Natrinema pellirubrum DSM 15624]
MAFESGLAAVVLLVGRLLFGGLVIYQGINHFLAPDAMAGYAEAKGVPAPKLGVIASGVVLVLGGLGLVLGVYPVVAAGALAVFFLVATPLMHDFWAVPDDQRQNEMNHFTKNVELFAASLLVLVLASQPWGYALNVGL